MVRCGFKLKPKAVPRIAVFVNVKPHIAVSLRYGFAVIYAVSVLNGTVSVFLPQIPIGHFLNPICSK